MVVVKVGEAHGVEDEGEGCSELLGTCRVQLLCFSGHALPPLRDWCSVQPSTVLLCGAPS